MCGDICEMKFDLGWYVPPGLCGLVLPHSRPININLCLAKRSAQRESSQAGQRRQTQDLFPQGFVGSNPASRIPFANCIETGGISGDWFVRMSTMSLRRSGAGCMCRYTHEKGVLAGPRRCAGTSTSIFMSPCVPSGPAGSPAQFFATGNRRKYQGI